MKAGGHLDSLTGGQLSDTQKAEAQKSETQKISGIDKITKNEAKDILLGVYEALNEKGYNPVSQIVGYVLSGDPTYITSHKGARSLISRLERDELLEEMVYFYLDKNLDRLK